MGHAAAHTAGRTFAALLALAACATAANAQPPAATQSADEAWTTFARSGRNAAAPTRPAEQAARKVVLRAYGRTWTEPAEPAELLVPRVRVPTVFAVTAADEPGVVLGELVAYPDRDVAWDGKIALRSCGAPAWFDSWAEAVGLPAPRIAPADLAAAKLGPRDGERGALLIVGRPSAGEDFADAAGLAAARGVNVLVLDAAWFGAPAGPAAVGPSQFRGSLAEIGRQKWPKPLTFTSHRAPWPGVANRRAWIVDDTGLPLVEVHRPENRFAAEIAGPPDRWPPRALSNIPHVVVNYLPWQQRLGRTEAADAALLELLKAGADRARPNARDVEVTLVQPPRGLDLKDRPVLAAALAPRAQHGAIRPEEQVEFVKIIDLRGPDEQAEYLTSQRQSMQEFVGHDPNARLLILGDSEMLDRWKWLKLDRDGKRIGADNVQWLADDALPPSEEQRIRLMLTLSELGVPLAPPQDKETKR